MFFQTHTQKSTMPDAYTVMNVTGEEINSSESLDKR
jgi:hypothetical protein